MKIKKIVTGILGVGVVSGIAFLAYKVGENEGRQNERLKSQVDDLDDDDIQFYDEPDEMCLSPKFEKHEEVTMPEVKPAFAPLSSIKAAGMSDYHLVPLLIMCIEKKSISAKTIENILSVDRNAALEVIDAFQKAGYIGTETGNHRYPVYLTYADLSDVTSDDND